MRRIAQLLKVLALGLLLLGASAGAQRLTMAQVSNPVTLDPNRTFNGLSFSVTNQVYENLVYFGTDGVIQPRLAESWEFTEPNVLELKIREGVTFHDGTPLNAAAVVASLEHFLDPEATNPGRFVLSRLSEVRATGEYTVELVTETPFAPLLAHLAHPVAAIVQAGLGESLDRHPVGTGPFRFVSWEQDAQVLLEANPDYWGGEPAIKEVVVRIIPDVSTIMVELRSGGVDAFYGIPADSCNPSPTRLARSSALPRLGQQLRRLQPREPRCMTRVRQAIAHVIDKELIGEIVNGLPAVAAIPPTVAFAAEDLGNRTRTTPSAPVSSRKPAQAPQPAHRRVHGPYPRDHRPDPAGRAADIGVAEIRQPYSVRRGRAGAQPGAVRLRLGHRYARRRLRPYGFRTPASAVVAATPATTSTTTTALLEEGRNNLTPTCAKPYHEAGDHPHTCRSDSELPSLHLRQDRGVAGGEGQLLRHQSRPARSHPKPLTSGANG